MSQNSNDYVNKTRQNLVEALAEKKNSYFFHMKRWFRMRITKEEFDSIARSLLPNEQVHLHNEFLMAILTKCQLFQSSYSPPTLTSLPIVPISHIKSEFYPLKVENEIQDKKYDINSYATATQNLNTLVPNTERKKAKVRRKTKAQSSQSVIQLEPVNLHDIAPAAELRETTTIADAGAGHHSRYLHMLDAGPLKGRVLLAVWDYGLSSVCDDVALLLHEAVKQLLKNILSSVISKRKGYRIREKSFLHNMSTLPPNPWLRNSANIVDWCSESLGMALSDTDLSGRLAFPTVQAVEVNAAQLASFGPHTERTIEPMSVLDLFTTLKTDKGVIPCHSVYSMNMERISSKLWQPGWTQIEQESIYAKDASLRQVVRAKKLANASISHSF